MSERVVRNVENDYLMCSICLGRYRDPRLLPCGHTFCKQCLEDHIRQTITDRGSLYFSCPNDRTQIQRPAPGMAPKDWASAFPVDTFLCSLLSAVMIHASVPDENTEKLKCEVHKGRLKEFYCLRCAVSACPYCVVKSHKAEKCECVPVEEAVEKCQPKIEILRRKLEQQMQQARQAMRGDNQGQTTLNLSKDCAMRDLTDLETKLSFFYQTAMKQLQDMKNTIKDTGKGKLTENQQVSVILENINGTAEKFDEVCNHGAGFEILGMISKIGKQVNVYDNALKTLNVNSSSMEVHFAVNHQLERVFETAPALGSVVIQGGDIQRSRQTFNSAMSSTPFLATPRGPPNSARSTPLSSRSMISPRTGRSDLGRRSSEPAMPQRAKFTFSAKPEEQVTSCWQLTGIAVIGDYVIATDAHNGLLVKCEIGDSTTVQDHLSLECPVCVSGVAESLDALVTLPEKSALALVDTETDLILKQMIDTSKPYEGICGLEEDKFVASCCVVGRQSIDIIDIQGQVLKTIDRNNAGENLFSWPRFLSTTPSGNILVSDRDQRSLLCVDQEGSVKWVYQAPASPWGVSCHGEGSVYLCLDNNSVQVLSEGGRLQQSRFITGRDGVNVPYAVHAHGEYLAVTEWGASLFQPNSPWVHVYLI